MPVLATPISRMGRAGTRSSRGRNLMHRHLRKLARVTVGAVLAALNVATPAAARTPVDPNTLNPAPPDFFNAACERTGNQIICTLAFDTVDDVTDEPSGIMCGSTELLFSQKRAVVGKRYYDG